MNWKAAITVSVIVSATATIIHQLFSTGGAYYFSQVDWEKVNVMPYSEAQSYLAERTKNYTGWESLMNSIYYPHFWLGALVEFGFLLAIGVVSCLLYSRASNA